MARLGFVGLGAMGGRVVKQLLDAGHSVTGYNRTRSKAQWLLDAGMQWGDSPRAVAEAVDIVFTMVTNTSALQQVVEGPDGILAGLGSEGSAGTRASDSGEAKVYIDMSTVSPAASRELAARVTARGACMLDVPVSGSVITLEQGKLSLMVGGDQATFERVKPILLDIGPKGPLYGRQRPGCADEDRHQPQPASSDHGPL
ncbi:MAG: NAD(P)-binding domain-containing protein [Chloroflexota bacterium]|nr:NAD(P)-binding domain-containing protein [Chloroflexota bacterium]